MKPSIKNPKWPEGKKTRCSKRPSCKVELEYGRPICNKPYPGGIGGGPR